LVVWGGVFHFLANRRVRQWTKEVLIPEAERSGIDLAQLITVLKDLPPATPHSYDELGPLQNHTATILEAIAASGSKK
jgi:hypothetical protein